MAHSVLAAPLAGLESRRKRLIQPQTADQVCNILGTPEYKPWLRERVKEFAFFLDFPSKMMRRFRIYRESEVPRALVSAGGVKVINDESHASLEVSITDVRTAKRPEIDKLFIPIVMTCSGEFRHRGARSLSAYFEHYYAEMLDSLPIVLFHQMTESILAFKLGLYHPFARWCNDGLANLVALRLSHRFLPELRSHAPIVLPKRESALYRRGVNLITWRQEEFSRPEDVENEEFVKGA